MDPSLLPTVVSEWNRSNYGVNDLPDVTFCLISLPRALAL